LAVSIDDLPDDLELLKKRVVELAAQKDELAAQKDELAAQKDELAAQKDELAVQKDELTCDNRNLEARNAFLEMKLAELLRRRVSQQQEQADDGQRLFGFVHEFADQTGRQLDEAQAKADDEHAEPSNSGRRTGRQRGRRKIPEDLLRVRTVYTLDEDVRRCACNKPMPKIGEVTSEELVRLDMLFVHQLVREKYACKKCEEGVLTAPGPERVLPKSMAGPSLLAWVVNAKFGDHLPYYRLERILEREGAAVSRATLCNWMRGCTELLQPIANEILRQILAGDYVQTDDTSKRIQRGKQGASRFGHVWVYTTPDGKVYYDFTETRERHGPLRVLGDFSGYVQADAYSGYDELFRRGKAVEVGCWAHAKRKFSDAREIDPRVAGKALAAIKRLYDIEREAKRRGLAPKERKALRQKRAPPILGPLREWLQAEAPRVLQRSDIAQAIGYVVNQWDALNRYLEDGRIEIDNNRAERMVKPIAIGRKNDLFVFTEETGQKATVLMSLVESCKAIGVDPRVYLNDVLQALRHDPTADVTTLTPQAWRQQRDENELRQRHRQGTEALLPALAAAVANR
jgi:transposase